MQKITTPLFMFFSFIAIAIFFVAARPIKVQKQAAIAKPIVDTNAKIQVAILLDVSGSMDGLIEQAKSQLWNMVNILGRAKCEGVNPNVEIALYEYGRTNNDPKNGYVKQINSFINNLDSLSENLFSLKTDGGEEYCGQVIFNAVKELKWDTAKNAYKVIFIAGNEDFLQGNLKYTEACKKAKEKGVIVNTIYCGDKMAGIKEHWNLGGECGAGSYTNINSNAKGEEIPTPYDSLLYVYNWKLNGSYVGYNSLASNAIGKQSKVDNLNVKMRGNASLQRITAKATKSVYKNEEWDLIDAYSKDKNVINKVDTTALPDSVRTITKVDLEKYVIQKTAERDSTQKEIAKLSLRRDAYIAEEKKKRAVANNEPTLETEIEKIIKMQVKRFNMIVE